MTAAQEPWIIVWWDERGGMYALTDEDGNIVARPFDEIKDTIDAVLDDPDRHSASRRYALSAELARRAFGLDVK